MDPAQVTHIVVHCSATPDGVYFDADTIDAWHRARGFNKIGYHFVVLLDGTIQVGRMVNEKGAHVKDKNTNTIGVCYIGGGGGKDTRTIKQKTSLSFLIATLKRMCHQAQAVGHRDLSPDKNGDGKITKAEWVKLCPCFNATFEYRYL